MKQPVTLRHRPGHHGSKTQLPKTPTGIGGLDDPTVGGLPTGRPILLCGARAIENMRRICEEHLDGRYDLDIIDIYEHPDATRELQVVATPTLIKMLPEPLRRIIGDLSDKDRVLAALNIVPPAGRPRQA